MSQATNVIASGSGLAVRTAINSALAAINSGHSGTAAPSYIAGGMLYWRTDVPGSGTWTLYAYDGSSSVALGTLNTSTHVWTPANAIASSTFTTKGDLLKGGVSGTPARFGVGTALYGLYTNAAADDLEWRRNGYEKIADDASPSSASTVDFTGIPAGVKALRVLFNLLPATNGVYLHCRFSQSAAWNSANYATAGLYGGSGGDVSSGGTGGGTEWSLTGGVGVYNLATGVAAAGISGVIDLPNIQTTRYVDGVAVLRTFHTANGTPYAITGNGRLTVSGAIDGIRLYFHSGNIAEGKVSLLGLRG